MRLAHQLTDKGGLIVSKPQKGVYIAIPNYRGTVVTALAGWLFSLSPSPDETFYLDAVAMQPVDSCRNEIVHRFLSDSKLEWLFMIDDDIVPWPTILDMRLKGHLVISGLTYITKSGVPIVCGISERRGNNVLFGGFKEAQGDPIEVVGVGAGALMIHRSVLEKMRPPWFRFTYKYDGRRAQGEDLYFSKKARKAGHTLWLDTTCPCGHVHASDIRLNAAMLSVALDSETPEEFSKFFGLLDPNKDALKKKK